MTLDRKELSNSPYMTNVSLILAKSIHAGKNELTQKEKYIQVTKKSFGNGCCDLDFEGNIGNLQFLSVFDKENPCAIKKLSV